MTDKRRRKAVRKPPSGEKEPFDIGAAVRLIRKAVRPYPQAALFELAEEGHGSVFEILVACIISIRTFDETTLPVSRRLFARAWTPAEPVSPSQRRGLRGAHEALMFQVAVPDAGEHLDVPHFGRMQRRPSSPTSTASRELPR